MRRKRGFALVYVIVILAVMLTLAGAVSVFILQGRKNRSTYGNDRNFFYYSDSGIEKAYGLLQESVDRAFYSSADRTDEKIDRMIQEDVELLDTIGEKIAEGVPQEDLPYDQLQLYGKDGELNRDKLKSERNKLFHEDFKEYFRIEDGTEPFEDVLDRIENYDYGNGAESFIEITVDNKKEVLSNMWTSEESIELVVSSRFKSSKHEKGIRGVIELKIPSYWANISYPIKYVNVQVAPILSNALIAKGDIHVGGELSIEGNLYSKGRDEGVVLENDNGAVNVSGGDVTSVEGVKYSFSNGGSGNKGSITLSGGNLFTRNILMEREAVGSSLIVNGDVYVQDDLQIDAEEAEVDIVNYYGISDGSSSFENKVDNSSSIIINSYGIGNGGTTVSIRDKMILAGTSYIKGLKNPAGGEGFDYQTGESLSIKGNYIAYTKELQNSWDTLNNLGESIDGKYEFENTGLAPLDLITNYSRFTSWYITNEDENGEYIYFDISDSIREKYSEACFIRDGGGEYIIPIGEKWSQEDKFIGDMEISQGEEFEILDAEKNLIGSREFKKINDNMELFKYTEGDRSWVLVNPTPGGIVGENMDVAETYTIEGVELSEDYCKIGKFGELESQLNLGDSYEVILQDKFLNIISRETKVVKDYKKYYLNVGAEKKSEIIERFYDDYRDDELIKGEDGVYVGDINESIYSGAVVYQGGVVSQNYTVNPLENENIIRYKEDIYKDKVLFMDLYEKGFEDSLENPFENKNIDEFDIVNNSADREQYQNMVDRGETPRNQEETVLVPDSFIDLKGKSKIDEFFNRGLYVNPHEEDVVLCRNSSTDWRGKEVLQMDENNYGVIVVNGNLILDGNFNINGIVIAMGDVFIAEGASINIIYNEDIVTEVLAKEGAIAREIFLHQHEYKKEEKSMIVYDQIEEEEEGNPLKIKKWVVIN